MKTIYLSPHLDDAVFSCGGWIWEQTREGRDVEIWTICAGDPPGGQLSGFAEVLHRSWNLGEDAVRIRRQEDQEACRVLGAKTRHFPYLDCIYRNAPEGEPYYQTEADLFGGLDPREISLIDDLCSLLLEELPQGAEVLAPLGIGNHVDHELTRKAASRLDLPLLFYADYPYAGEGEGENILNFLAGSSEWQPEVFPINKKGLEKWVEAALKYGSQIPTFWADHDQLQDQISEFSDFIGGMTLWRPLES